MKTLEKIKAINLGIALQQRMSRNGKTTEIYCGDEDRAQFLTDALGQLGLNVECETFTVDGEYFVGVKQ